MSEQKEAGGDKPTEAKPKSKNKLIFIGLGVLSLIAGAGVPMFLSGGEVADEAVVVAAGPEGAAVVDGDA